MTLPALFRIWEHLEQKTILQRTKQLIQYIVLEIQLRSLKYAAAIRFRKNFPFPSKGYKARTVCWCKQPTSNSFQTLQTVYTCSNCMINQLFILLANVLASICSEISKIRLILWMVCTCNVKGLQEVEKLNRNECTLHRWPRPPVMSDCSRPYQ